MKKLFSIFAFIFILSAGYSQQSNINTHLGGLHTKVTVNNILKVDSFMIIRAVSDSMTFDSTGPALSNDKTLTFRGASLSDGVIVAPAIGSIEANSCYTAWVSAKNEITIRFNNYSGGSITPNPGRFYIYLYKHP